MQYVYKIYLFVTSEFKELDTQLSKFIRQFYFCNQLARYDHSCSNRKEFKKVVLVLHI